MLKVSGCAARVLRTSGSVFLVFLSRPGVGPGAIAIVDCSTALCYSLISQSGSGASGFLAASSTTPLCSASGRVCGCWAPTLWDVLSARAGVSCSPCPSSPASGTRPPGCSSPTLPTHYLGTSSWHRIQAVPGRCFITLWPWCSVASTAGTRCSSTMWLGFPRGHASIMPRGDDFAVLV